MDNVFDNAELVSDKEMAVELLQAISDKLHDYSQLAESLVSQHFPDHLLHAKHYGTFSFGWSTNPYDQTFSRLIEELDKEVN